MELNEILRKQKAAKQQQKRRDFLTTWQGSSGYVPNFAAAALQQAIAREKSAGLSDSQIYVDQNSSLKSSMNPMGLMVANRRDEPAGGFQGIARARKEGMNPKLYGAANGFVPNYVKKRYGKRGKGSPQLNPSPSEETVSTNDSPEINIGNVEGVNKGFGDMAGKIIILQSALTFLSSAVGEGETSMEKFTQQLAQSAGNITSLGFLFQQIAGTETKTKFGGFIKNLGLVGTVAAGVYEGFKLIDYGFKEFSGQNKRTADALAKLETAAQGAIISLEDLTPEGQRTAQETGKAALEAFSGSFLSNLFSQAAGKNPRIQERVGLLSAQGVNLDAFKTLLEKETGKVAAERFGVKNAEDLQRLFNEQAAAGARGGGRGIPIFVKDIINEEDLSKAISNLFTDPDVKKSAEALFKLRSGLAAGTIDPNQNLKQIQETIPSLANVDPKIAQSILDKNKTSVETKKQEQKVQNAINFGERLSLEIAKQRIDSVFQLKQINEESLKPAERILQFQLETLDLSSREKILKESQLKNLDLERKKRIDILSATKSVVDEASKGGLSVKTEDLDKLTTFLDQNLGKSTDELSQKLQDAFKLPKDQADNLLKSLEQQTKNINASTEAQKQLNGESTNFKLQVDNVNSSLQNQLSIFQRIAQTAQLISSFDISSRGLEIGRNETEISRLETLASDPTLTQGQQDAYKKQVIDLQKRNNELKKGNELSQFEEKQTGILLKQREKENELIKLREENGDPAKIKALESEIENLNIQLNTEINNYNAATAAIDGNNKILDIQASQISKVTGAYASYLQQLEAFRLGAGGRVGSAMLDELGATDINSLMQARIKQNVEADASGLNDKDRYKTVQEETRLRQIQFDLATAESATRKRELEYELKYTKELIDLKNQGASDQELIDARNRQILEQRSGGRGFEKGLDTIQDRINNYRTTLGEEIPNLFSSNLAQGLNDAISGAKDLKTALTDAATSFFQEITRKNISNLADMVTGGIGKGASSGGGILSSIFSFFGGGSKTGVTAAASGGMIKGGSGTKDDVPAMLMGGEYVMKKSAVNKYGKGFLDALNNGKMRGYATGGLVDPDTFPTQTGRGGFYTPGDYGQGAITGKNELLTFATQSSTSGQYDYMGGFGMGGASVGLEAESARLSSFGRENSPMFERVQESKNQAFQVYLEGLQKEKEYAELLDQIAKDKKARKKALQRAIISAVVTSALSVAGGAMSAGASNAAGLAKAAGKGFLGQASAGIKGAFGFGGKTGKGGLGNLLTGNFSKAFTNLGSIAKGQGTNPEYIFDAAKSLKGVTAGNRSFVAPKGTRQEQTFSKNMQALSEKDLASYGIVDYGSDGEYRPYKPTAALLPAPNWQSNSKKRASGGLISGGSNIRDDVPAMLTGGEFVLNNRATQRIGVQNLNQLNNGQSVSGEGASAEMTQALISKLDELIQATQNSSSENVVVNVSSNEAGGQNQENNAGAEKELHKKIRQAVLDVIAQEKRLGGSLEKSR
jgi:hypothetical protein